MKLDKIYIIHYDKLVERKQYLEPQLQKLGVDFEFRSLYNREAPELESKELFDPSEQNKQKRKKELDRTGLSIYAPCLQQHKGYKAVTLEHFFTYKEILKQNIETALVLEDDVCFKDGFFDHIHEYINKIPHDFDIAYLGHGCSLDLPYQTDDLFGLHPRKQSRCSDSYIFNRKTLEIVIDSFLPFFGAIDWELNYIQALHNLKVYWCTKPLIVQGSQHGKYKSSF